MSMLHDWIGIDSFAWPWLLLGVLLPLLQAVVVRPASSRQPALRAPWGERLQQVLGNTAGIAAVRRLPWLAMLGWCLLCVAAARPQQLGPPMLPPQQARELMLAVDLSASMDEEDMWLGGQDVDRLTAAKAVLADFLDRRAGDRVGLIVFGDHAYALTPLTTDIASVREQLQASVSGLAGRATAIGDAIALATKRLQGRDGEKVLILLTDGVNTAGMLAPEKAAQIAADNGVRIHTIAFGGDGGGVSVFGLRLAMGGDAVDERGLKAIAQRTGGKFFRARDTAQLAGIYSEIDKLEPIQGKGRKVRPRIERYPLPLGLALGCLMLAWVLRGRRA